MLALEDRLRNIMADVFDVPAADISESASAHTIPGWDSLKHINLILSLQKEFKVRFEDEEIPTMINFEMIVITLKAYLE